jgi:predicted metal-dependent RNase
MASLAWLGACGSVTQPREPSAGRFVVSNPVQSVSPSRSGGATAGAGASGGDVAYISLRPGTMPDAIEATITGIMPSLGFRPRVHTVGPVHSGVSDDVRPHLLAVLREALSNVVRHAAASRVHLVVRVGDGRLTITVTDAAGNVSSNDQTVIVASCAVP